MQSTLWDDMLFKKVVAYAGKPSVAILHRAQREENYCVREVCCRFLQYDQMNTLFLKSTINRV